MTRATLLALASRVEAATGADSGLDSEIHHAILNGVGVGSYGAQPAYTASLDAAMSLVPSDAYWRLGHDGDGADPAEYKADVIVPKLGGVDARGRAIAVTPPLALTAACLRARAIAGSMTDD